MKRTLAVVGVLAVVLLAGVVIWSLTPDEPIVGPGPVRSIYPAGTVTPEGYRPGLVVVRGYGAGYTVTPAPGQVAYHIPIAWSEIQPDLTATPNWNSMLTRVAYVDGQGQSSWISLYSYGATIYAPAGAPTVAYATGKYVPDWSNPKWTNAYTRTIASMMSVFGADPRVSGFAVGAGYADEMTTGTDLTAIEVVVPCSAFLDFVEAATLAHRSGTDKALTMATGIGACGIRAYDSDREATKWFFDTINFSPVGGAYVGYRYNGLAPDENRSWMYGTPVPWGRIQAGKTYQYLGGAYFEPKNLPSGIPTAMVQSHADYMLLNAASAKADNVFLQSTWWPYIDSRVLDVVTATLGTTSDNSTLAWVWFREAEIRKLNVGTGFEYSGVPGPFTHLASIVGSATPVTYCSTAVKATAEAWGGATPPSACSTALTTPVARESRNALGYAASSTVGIDVADDWVHGGLASNTYSVTLRYLDKGTGTITLGWKSLGGVESTHVITKTNTLGWTTAGWTMTAALANGYTTHDVELRLAGDESILNSLTILYEADVATPTPSPTPTATRTPTPTPTATRTPTATPEPSSVYLNEICPDPGYDTNLDGQVEPGDAYVELYNGESDNVDLDGWSLVIGSETYDIPQTSLVAGSYKVIYGWDITIPVTGTATLYSPLDVSVDSVTWPAQSAGTCYARDPDGVNNWTSGMVMTVGTAN